MREESHNLFFKHQVITSRNPVLNLPGPARLRWVITLPLANTWQSSRNQQMEHQFFCFSSVLFLHQLPRGVLQRREGDKVPQKRWATTVIVARTQTPMSYIETPPLILGTLIKENMHTALNLCLSDADPVSISFQECMHLKKTLKQWYTVIVHLV